MHSLPKKTIISGSRESAIVCPLCVIPRTTSWQSFKICGQLTPSAPQRYGIQVGRRCCCSEGIIQSSPRDSISGDSQLELVECSGIRFHSKCKSSTQISVNMWCTRGFAQSGGSPDSLVCAHSFGPVLHPHQYFDSMEDQQSVES